MEKEHHGWHFAVLTQTGDSDAKGRYVVEVGHNRSPSASNNSSSRKNSSSDSSRPSSNTSTSC